MQVEQTRRTSSMAQGWHAHQGSERWISIEGVKGGVMSIMHPLDATSVSVR